MNEITLGGGCFWCTEAVFKKIRGITEVTPGYMGGTKNDANYEAVCTGKTKHVEVVQIKYEPQKVELKRILEVFFKTHDPTTPNRQGNDVGPQYHSTIFYSSEEQLKEINKFIETLNDENICTTIRPAEEFFKAESYHKDFYEKNKDNPYCQFIIKPKLSKI